jgi:hypothetical protein
MERGRKREGERRRGRRKWKEQLTKIKGISAVSLDTCTGPAAETDITVAAMPACLQSTPRRTGETACILILRLLFHLFTTLTWKMTDVTEASTQQVVRISVRVKIRGKVMIKV